MGEPTNEKIYEKLLEIERMLQKEKQEEDTILDDEKEIKHLMAEKGDKKFSNVLQWKELLWDNCPHKKHEMISETQIGFVCDLTKKSCDFLICPENSL
jgi:hypothetical protein